MANLFLMVGLPCSGKTTAATLLAREKRALLLGPDPWQLRLFGDDYANADHLQRHTAIEQLLWNLAQEALKIGTNVILDFGFWAREERNFYREAAHGLGASCQICYMDTPLEEIARRLEIRNAQEQHFRITLDDIRGWARCFQPPDEEELTLR